MIDKLIHAKGGLHNRIARQILLSPFTLDETRDYLASHGIRWKRRQRIELYLGLGGIPHYLRLVERGHSAAQTIGARCFARGGELSQEFDRLLASLFAESAVHQSVVRAIASTRTGIDRNTLLAKGRTRVVLTIQRRECPRAPSAGHFFATAKTADFQMKPRVATIAA
jgi:hypothetical protein